MSKQDFFYKTNERLVNGMIDQYSNDASFGLQCSPPTDQLNGEAIDNPGLVTGVTGILLSLLYFTSKEIRPWTSIFLLT